MTTYTGKNLETALQKASQATGIPVDALKYDILAGKTGGYALIKVTGGAAVAAAPAAALVEKLSGDPNAPAVEGERRERPPRDDRRDRGDRGGDRREGRGGGDRREGRGGDRGDRGPRPDRGGDRGDRGPRPDRGDRGGDRGPRPDRGDRGDRGDRPRPRRDDFDVLHVPADGPTTVTVAIEGELSAFGLKVQEVLVVVLEKMGFGLHVKLAETADEVICDLHSGVYHDAFVAKDLELLDALELLLEKAVHLPAPAGAEGEAAGGGPRKKIHLDTNGHRAKADLDLAASARHMAERALDERRVFKLGPLDPRARRVVHMTLKEVAGVITKSEGEGVFRRVCIIPKDNEPAGAEVRSIPSDDSEA